MILLFDKTTIHMQSFKKVLLLGNLVLNLLVGLPWGGAQVVFEINDFKAEKESLTTVNDAKLFSSFLRVCPATSNTQGAAWYSEQKINLADGFYTEFEFKIRNTDNAKDGGDGFCFVMQNQGSRVVGGTGNNLGYRNLDRAVAIEFDIVQDVGEESANHVCLSFFDPEKGYYRKYATVHSIPELNDGKSHFARIEYREGNLVFYLDSYLFPILTVRIDIPKRINSNDGMGWVGFTAATSNAYADHDLLSWTLGNYSPPPKDIKVEEITVEESDEIVVKNRKLKISIWDDDLIDGDTVSVKVGDEWILTDHKVQAEKKVIQYTLKGFSSDLVMYAHNMGLIPPNTAAIEVNDGEHKYRFKMKADLESSQSVKFRYQAPE
jgi:hypothetical protein